MSRETLIEGLRPLALGGLKLIVHASLPELGLTDQDAVPLCEAILACVGASGTVVMPAFTPETILGPGRPPVAFHPELPVSPDLGRVPEAFRRLPNVLRSLHPSHSFSAHGAHARDVLSTQRDGNPLGPIKKLNVMRGHVLLLGASLSSCAAIHLAEELAPEPFLARATALRVNAAGYEERVVVERVPGCSRAFDRLEDRLDAKQVVSVPTLGGSARRVPVRYLVQLAGVALAADPAFFICDDARCPGCQRKREALRTPPEAPPPA